MERTVAAREPEFPRPRVCWAADANVEFGNAYGYTLANRHLRAALREVADLDCGARVAFHLCYAPQFRPVPGRLNVLMSMYENPDVPAPFIVAMRRADAVVVPSTYCADIFEPFLRARPFVVPLGVDTKRFIGVARPRSRKRPFRWLWVGAHNERKGWREVLDAWRARFWLDSSVQLYLKTTDVDPTVARQAAETGILPKQFGGISGKGNLLVDSRAVSDAEMLRLYADADGFVLPTMGEGWGQCVDPSTLIQVPDGAVPMSDVQVGDQVLAGDGRFHLVLGKIAREADTVDIRSVGTPAVRVTLEHPFLRLPKRSDPRGYYERHRDEQPEWVAAESLRCGDLLATPIPEFAEPLPEYLDLTQWVGDLAIEADAEHIWCPMGYSPSGSKLSLSSIAAMYGVSKRVAEDARALLAGRPRRPGIPHGFARYRDIARHLAFLDPPPAQRLRVKRFVRVDAAFLELVGWYLAEGSNNGGRGVELDMHRDELPIAERLGAYMKKAFGVDAAIALKPNVKVCRLQVSSSVLSRLFTSLCGKGASAKRLHPVLWRSARYLGPLMRGYVSGDGHIGRDISMTTVSRALAWQLRAICLAAGFFARIVSRSNTRGFPSALPAWIVVIGGESGEGFARWAGLSLPKRPATRRVARHVFKREGYFFAPVRSITAQACGLVMDIKVDESPSFVGNGVLLHNTLLEAMATALPCVATLVTGVRDFADESVCVGVRHHEETVMVQEHPSLPGSPARVRVADVADLGRKMHWVARHWPEARRLGLRAHRRAQQFTWDAAARRLVETLAMIAGEPAKEARQC